MTKPIIIDRRRKSMGWQNPWQTRRVDQITHIGVHHSATASGNTEAFERNWANMGWTNGGYVYVILRDGRIEQNYPHTVVTNGVSGHNLNTLNVCVVGNGSFTPEQESSLLWLLRKLMRDVNVKLSNVLGHNEFSGTATACPGRDMGILRELLKNLGPSATTHVVKAGQTLWSISQQRNTTVDALKEANNLNSTHIIVGQVLRLPSSSGNIFTGQRLNLSSVPLFANSTTSVVSRQMNGNFFVWSRDIVNGRIRITNTADRVGGNPATNVTGWINVNDI